ncbi:hypothetical protein VS877_22475, partial [Salmonella enterica subsp. enterica serovar Paratyphi A]|nr:hypothetical protein [Salmonella enterica subsp. enterica serovar Paratyphi A]
RRISVPRKQRGGILLPSADRFFPVMIAPDASRFDNKKVLRMNDNPGGSASPGSSAAGFYCLRQIVFSLS